LTTEEYSVSPSHVWGNKYVHCEFL